VSHQPERKAKNCLNCGARVVGRYCHICGQENIETKESFWSLTKHFVFDIFHFDGKFFHTLKYIFVKPGLVAREYCLGKRMSFLHPIRMYLFTSAIFFIVFASVNNISFGTSKNILGKVMSRKDRLELAADYKERLKQDPEDSSISKIIALLTDTTKKVTGDEILAMDAKQFFTISGRRYNSVKEYDSIQNSLSSGERDGWFIHMLRKKTMMYNEKYKGRTAEASKIIGESFLHRLPYMLFLSLPFFALILKLLYRRHKIFYYSDHAIFTIYHYILSFILLLIMFSVSTLQERTGWNFLSYLGVIFFLAWPGYLLLELKNFYKQGWVKTAGKFILLNLMGSIVIFILFAAFLILSIFEL
jgi:hypothetical protein